MILLLPSEIAKLAQPYNVNAELLSVLLMLRVTYVINICRVPYTSATNMLTLMFYEYVTC